MIVRVRDKVNISVGSRLRLGLGLVLGLVLIRFVMYICPSWTENNVEPAFGLQVPSP